MFPCFDTKRRRFWRCHRCPLLLPFRGWDLTGFWSWKVNLCRKIEDRTLLRVGWSFGLSKTSDKRTPRKLPFRLFERFLVFGQVLVFYPPSSNNFSRWMLAGNRLGHVLDGSDDAKHDMKTKENDQQSLLKLKKTCSNCLLILYNFPSLIAKNWTKV